MRRRKAEDGRRKGFVQHAISSFLLPPSSFALCVVLAGGSAFAQSSMVDPTRPPPGFGSGDADAAPAGGPVLQSVIISASGSAAIISGETVKVGQRYGDAVLIKVAESEVVLKGAGGTQVLKLYPAVDKRAAAPEPAKAPARGTRAPGTKAAPEPGAPARQGRS